MRIYEVLEISAAERPWGRGGDGMRDEKNKNLKISIKICQADILTTVTLSLKAEIASPVFNIVLVVGTLKSCKQPLNCIHRHIFSEMYFIILRYTS